MEQRRPGADPEEAGQEVIVTSTHLRTIPYFNDRAGYCLPKARAWFRAHGLNWAAFLRHGIDADQLLATGDGMAAELVKWARECEGRADG